MFQEVIGLEGIKRNLENAIRLDKIASAYIFVGSSGTGKGLLAREFAKIICCVEKTACNQCINCKLFNEKVHPDFKVFRPGTNFVQIATIQEINNSLSIKPAYSDKMVLVLKRADKMNNESANAFLKNLEEPPTNSILILTCEHEHQVPETILSRCHAIYFPNPSTNLLMQLISKEISPEEYQWMLPFMKKGIRKDWLQERKKLNKIRLDVCNLLNDINSVNWVKFTLYAEKCAKDGFAYAMLEFLGAYFCDLLTYNRTGSDAHFYLPEMKKAIGNNSSAIEPENLINIFEFILQAEFSIEKFTNKVLALEGCLIQIKQILAGKTVF